MENFMPFIRQWVSFYFLHKSTFGAAIIMANKFYANSFLFPQPHLCPQIKIPMELQLNQPLPPTHWRNFKFCQQKAVKREAAQKQIMCVYLPKLIDFVRVTQMEILKAAKMKWSSGTAPIWGVLPEAFVWCTASLLAACSLCGLYCFVFVASLNFVFWVSAAFELCRYIKSGFCCFAESARHWRLCGFFLWHNRNLQTQTSKHIRLKACHSFL